MYLSSYLADLNRRAIISPTTSTAITTTILELQRAISDLEKIATTPIPSAYTFHLHLTVYFYLFFIPFQVYTYIGWVAIPATAVASVIYLGFLEIGMQIEMPFYYDQSDLDLDEFVLRISHQIAQLTAVSLNRLFPPLHVIGLKKKSPGTLMIPDDLSSQRKYFPPTSSSPTSTNRSFPPYVLQRPNSSGWTNVHTTLPPRDLLMLSQLTIAPLLPCHPPPRSRRRRQKR